MNGEGEAIRSEHETIRVDGFKVVQLGHEEFFALQEERTAAGYLIADLQFGIFSPLLHTTPGQNDFAKIGKYFFEAEDLSQTPLVMKDPPDKVLFATLYAGTCRAGLLIYKGEQGLAFRVFHFSEEGEHNFEAPPTVEGFELIGGVYGGGTFEVLKDNVSEKEQRFFEEQLRLTYVPVDASGRGIFYAMIDPLTQTMYFTYHVIETD